jgi:predicted choloylglycine hydrolase
MNTLILASNGNKRWKDVVRKSRNYCACEADEYGSVYGPQATNYVKMIKNKYEIPKAAINKKHLS